MQGMAATLVLGAKSINIGMRFCATKEVFMHNDIKRALVNVTESNTQLTFRKLINIACVLKNAISGEVVAKEYHKGGVKFASMSAFHKDKWSSISQFRRGG